MDWHISILIDVINVGMCSNIAFRFLARNLACRNNDEIWFLYRNVYSRNRRMSQNASIFLHHKCIGGNCTFFMYKDISCNITENFSNKNQAIQLKRI